MSHSQAILKPEDYFRFNAPFRQWLFDYKNSQLGDFKTDDARILFASEFIVKWNNSELPNEYYQKGPNLKTDFSKKKRYNTTPRNIESSRLFDHKPVNLPEQSHVSYVRREPKLIDKAFMKRKAEDLEELVPKKEGHAKLVQDRRIKSAHTRHEKSLDYEMPDESVFSSGGSEYARLLQLERDRTARREREQIQRKQEKQSELSAKMEKYNQREKEVQEMFLKMVKK